MNDAPPAFLGRGWSFPPNFDRHAASVVMVSGDVDIRQSLWILMSTGLGERIMLAPYGCDLLPQVFRSLSATMAGAVSLMVKNAIVEWEPRVVVDRVAVTESNDGSGGLDISIDYTVRQTNSRSNLVFPYYRREATIPGPVG